LLTWKELFMGCAILGLPIALILLEPDVGQAITYLPLLAIVLFLSSMRMWVVAALLVVCIGGAPLAYTVGVKTGLLHGYKLERINVILDPENADKRGFGYHTWQSMVTVGEGGLVGARGSEYSQSSLKFLPEPHTDFIFAVAAETTGFVGCLLLLASYALLLTRLITDARRSRDRTGMLVIMAIVGGLIFQIFINVGMALGLLPVIGVPLPLMSAGLSSVLATFIAIGFALSVQLRRFVN
jgi:rod shape determining protein RodA